MSSPSFLKKVLGIKSRSGGQAAGRQLPCGNGDFLTFGMVSFGINLQETCRLWPLDSAFDIHGYGELRYNLLGNGGHWFPGINAAEFDEAAIGEIGRKAGYPSLVNILHEAHDRFGDAPRKRLQQNN
jgi:predicted aldo/keto reductase-like oxidoreductase